MRQPGYRIRRDERLYQLRRLCHELLPVENQVDGSPERSRSETCHDTRPSIGRKKETSQNAEILLFGGT